MHNLLTMIQQRLLSRYSTQCVSHIDYRWTNRQWACGFSYCCPRGYVMPQCAPWAASRAPRSSDCSTCAVPYQSWAGWCTDVCQKQHVGATCAVGGHKTAGPCQKAISHQVCPSSHNSYSCCGKCCALDTNAGYIECTLCPCVNHDQSCLVHMV